MKARTELVTILGSKCVICAIDDPEMLHLDHIYDDGQIDLEKFGSGTSMYLYYLKHQDEAKAKLQVLCANHNWKKRYSKEKLSSPPEVKAEPLPLSVDPSYYFDRDSLENHMILWKDNARPPPIMIRHYGPNRDGKYCESIVFQVLADQESQKLFIRCPDCGWDSRVLIERPQGSHLFIGNDIKIVDCLRSSC